jgi:hypothetical protein
MTSFRTIVVLVMISFFGGVNMAKGACTFIALTDDGAIGHPPRAFVTNVPDTDDISIRTTAGQKICRVAAANSTMQFYSSIGSTLLFDSTSGGITSIHLFDWQECKSRSSPVHPGADIHITPDTITSTTNCTCRDAGKLNCICHAAQVVKVTPACGFREDRAASRKATIDTTGLDFTGTVHVTRPGLPGSAILPSDH